MTHEDGSCSVGDNQWQQKKGCLLLDLKLRVVVDLQCRFLKSSVKSFKVSCQQMAQNVLYNFISSPLSRACWIYFRANIWNYRIVLWCLAHGEALGTVPGGFQGSTKSANMNQLLCWAPARIKDPNTPERICPPQGRPRRNCYQHSYHARGGDGLQHEQMVSVSCILRHIRRDADSGLANAPRVPLWPLNPRYTTVISLIKL